MELWIAKQRSIWFSDRPSEGQPATDSSGMQTIYALVGKPKAFSAHAVYISGHTIYVNDTKVMLLSGTPLVSKIMTNGWDEANSGKYSNPKPPDCQCKSSK
jgi:hypothetical protein